jgi:hypothetical protein
MEAGQQVYSDTEILAKRKEMVSGLENFIFLGIGRWKKNKNEIFQA